MSSKKVTWNFGNNGKGTKTTVEHWDDGTTRVVKQNAHKDFFGFKNATSIINEKTIKRKKS